MDTVTRQKLLDTPALDMNIKPNSVRVTESGNLVISWRENGGQQHVSTFGSSWFVFVVADNVDAPIIEYLKVFPYLLATRSHQIKVMNCEQGRTGTVKAPLRQFCVWGIELRNIKSIGSAGVWGDGP